MSDYDDTDSQWDSMTEEEIRDWAAEFGTNDSWYWSDRQGCHVLIEDGHTTTRDLGTLIAAGGGNPVAEADYWLMVARMTEVAAACRLGQARGADAESPTFDNLLALTDAEKAYSTAQAIREELHATADTARALAAGRGEWIDLDTAWRQATTIARTEQAIKAGNDGPYECDRSLPAEDRERQQAAITHISERTGLPNWYIKGYLWDATDAYGRAPGSPADPDYFAPPDWAELTQRYRASDAADEAEAAWVRVELAETEVVYKELFDHDYYGDIVGDGQAEDSYSDQIWETVEGIAIGRLAERGVFPPDIDDDLSNVEGVDGVPTPVADAVAAPYNAPPVETLSGIPLEPYTDIETAEGKTTEEILADLQVELAAGDGAATGESEQPPTQPATIVTHFDTPRSGEPEVELAVTRVGESLGVGELSGESPGKPGAAEAVAGAHAAVLASAQTPRHDSPLASASDPVVEHQDHTQDAGDGR